MEVWQPPSSVEEGTLVEPIPLHRQPWNLKTAGDWTDPRQELLLRYLGARQTDRSQNGCVGLSTIHAKEQTVLGTGSETRARRPVSAQ